MLYYITTSTTILTILYHTILFWRTTREDNFLLGDKHAEPNESLELQARSEPCSANAGEVSVEKPLVGV